MPFTLTMPKLSPTMEEGTIAKWHKKEGDRVEAGDLLFEVSTDKATVEYNALDEGWLRKIIITDGQSATVNQPVAILTEDEKENVDGYKPEGVGAEKPAVKPPESPVELAAAAPKAPVSTQQPQGRILASPLAKKLAKDQGLDLSGVIGTGPGKRVMSRDLEQIKTSAKKAAPSVPAGSFTTETLSPIRKVIAQRLQEAKSTIPHFYVQLTVDAAPIVAFREQLKALQQNASVNDCVIKACALALRAHPVVNSGFNAKDNTLIRFQTVDISVAVSIDGGLITPIVKHADHKGLTEISAEVKALAKKAKEGKLEPAEFQGGSFTISNLGMFGVTNFQAIINPPQSAILAVSAILDVPVVKDGAVVPGKVMNLTLSVDHRVVDGVAAAEFLNELKRLLENPLSLLL